MNATQALASLQTQFSGRMVLPDDASYDDARTVFNAMIDRYPTAIAYAQSTEDVSRAVRWAAAQGSLLAVRGGGHNGGGLGVCDGGLVIDLSGLKRIEVDTATRTVRVGGGCLWREVDAATAAHGLAVPSGIIGSTGVGGLALGGGIGHLSRKYGLTVDNLLEAEVLLADGRVVRASASSEPDLFWALRGGGGNFGVVTRFTFRAHPVGTVIAGPMFWPLSQAAEVMRWYRDFIATAPEELNGFLALMKVPPVEPYPPALQGQTVCGVVWCHVGTAEQAALDMAPARAAVPPIVDGVQPMPFAMLQGAFDGLYTPGLQWYWRADFVQTLSDAAIEQHVQHAQTVPTLHSMMHLYPINGAAGRVGSGDTAFAYRDATWAAVIVGVSPDPADGPRISAWCKGYWEAVHPYGAGGAYVNFMMDEGAGRVAASYRGNYARLAAVKKRYDPGNVFRVNQNIAPT
jgi:FAD/FMN-containing dehydrogenase